MNIKDWKHSADFFFAVGIALIVSAIASLNIGVETLFWGGIIILIIGTILKAIMRKDN